MFDPKTNSFLSVGCFFIAVAALGCSGPKADYNLVQLVDAHGSVTLDGEPLVGATVMFVDPNDDTFSYGTTDANGSYTLQFDSEMKGVKIGNKIVRIITTKNSGGSSSLDEGGDPDAKPKEKESLPAKFNRNSELKVEVVRKKTTYDFSLVSK